MPLISVLIMNICIATSNSKCIEEMHVCMRDYFSINFYDKTTWREELVMPVQIQWCRVRTSN